MSILSDEFSSYKLVICSVPNEFKGQKTGVIMEPQKWCEDGIPVYLADPDAPVRAVCVRRDQNDTIELLK